MIKIINEGWASYWHSKLMMRHFLNASEIVQYADQHSGVVHTAPGSFNPYKIGIELWKDIEDRWNTGHPGSEWERLEGVGAKARHDDGSMKGREKIFQIRRIYNGVSFVDEFFTPELCERMKMYQTRTDPQTGETRVVSRDFPRVKPTLLHHLTNMGQPFIHVVDGNYLNRGELYHAHLRLLWGRPVHLQLGIKDEMHLLSCSEPGKELKKQRISENTPAAAHAMS